MNFLHEGERLIKDFEGFKDKAYLCPAGIPTIGYGHTSGVSLGMTCTQDQAEQWLNQDLTEFQSLVKNAVDPNLTDNQFSAAVCFAFNVKRWQTTPLFAFLHRGEIERAEAHWLLYCKADGKELEGLKRRRQAELDLFKAV